MTPHFAAAIDPVFEYVLGLLAQIEEGDEPDAKQEQDRLLTALERAEGALGDTPDGRLARYALVAWIDEVMLDAPWHGREWWKDNCLETRVSGQRNASRQFFDLAGKAADRGSRDALEVYYLAVVLGFQGFYSDNPTKEVCRSMKLPPSTGEWARRTAKSIQPGQGRPALAKEPFEGLGAPPLRGRCELLGALLWFVVLASTTAIIGWRLLPGILKGAGVG